MKKGDKASPSIILAGQALLVKMLITLEPHGIYGSNFEYFFIFFSILFCLFYVFFYFSLFFFSFFFLALFFFVFFFLILM